MIYTFETRLNVDAATDALLAANAAHWSFGLRKAWVLLYRQGLTKPQAYAELCKLGFTSHQAKSLLISAEMKQAALKELRKVEIRQLKLAVLKREAAVWTKTRKADALSKRLLKLREKRDEFAPVAGRPRSKRYLKVLSQLRELDAELAFCRNWIAQKERVLRDKRGKLARAQKALTENRFALCFGSKNLLAQRPGAHNPESPFESLAAWRQAWDDAREHQWWSVGATDKPQGNAEVQWLPEERQLRLRLTDRLAHERMDERGVPHSGGPQKVMPQRMACRFLVLDGVDFTSHRGAARAALLGAFGQRPVTMRVLYRRHADGSRAWYVQASVDVLEEPLRQSVTREAGVLGLDFNARGVAWCAVKPDGNRLRGQHGFFRWDLKSLPALERRQVIGTTVAQLVRHAQRLQLAVAIENLDFETKRLTARAGSVNKRYNDMLGSLPSSQFEQMIARACAREHLMLYSVNPLYSSVGGFAKYGRANRMDLLVALDTKFGLKQVANLGNKLSKKALPNKPLCSAVDLADGDATALRIDTVHKAKGESLDAVLYVTTKEHAQALLGGVATELGRIGYVAATRTRNLLWVAVPHNSMKELRPLLLARGFKEVGIAATPTPAAKLTHEVLSPLPLTEKKPQPNT